MTCEVCATEMQDWQLSPECLLHKCPRCGHVLRTLSDAPALAREDEYGEGPGGSLRIALTANRLQRRTGRIGPSSTVLEIGCGPDPLLAKKLAASGAQVIGLDPNVETHEVNDRLTLVRGGLGAQSAALKPWLGSIDVATAIHVLEHIPDLQDSLRTIQETLDSNGRFYAITPAGDSAMLVHSKGAWWMLEDPTHVRFFSQASLTLALTNAGFTQIVVKRLILDSMATDAATLVRRLKPAERPAGVLAQRSTKFTLAATLPFTLSMRAVAPRWRSVLEVTAQRASETKLPQKQ